MKKLFFIFFALITSTWMYSNELGHFFLNVEKDNVHVSNVESKLIEWLDLPTKTTFELFRDETDNLGIRHLSYHQLVNNIEIDNGIVLVHAKNNIVQTINGDIMDALHDNVPLHQTLSPLKAAQHIRKNASDSDAQLKIVKAVINGKQVYRYAYEVITEDFSEKKYVDAESGEIIKSIPLRYNADVAGTVSTMYNGTQAITCYEKDGTYYLMDNARGIVTLDATNNSYEFNDQATDITEEVMNVIHASSTITNYTTSWVSSWDLLLKSITISDVLQTSSWYSIGEGGADVYIKIKDANNNILYTSGYKDDPTFPTTFNIPNNFSFSLLPLYVEIWDYDPVGDDDFIDIFTMDTFGGDMLSVEWIGIGVNAFGTYTAIGSGLQPHFDAHWGMEKTLDFYRQKLNRNSFDNQGSIVYQLINIPIDLGGKTFPTNACAIQSDPFPMVYGTGLQSTNSARADQCIRPLVSIDIMAHEFTHLVTTNNGNGGLVYLGESGALNESFSDIIGIAVKKYATGNNDWLIGSDVMVNASNMRSMKNPNNSHDGRKGVLSSPQPKTYLDNKYWIDPTDTECDTCDNGGVHTNSGVQNFWFYLLSEGGSGINYIGDLYNVIGIGIDKAVQIAYRNLIFYLTPEATFADAREGSLQSAIDLYGKDSPEYQSVMNAWYAVGVGEKYVAPVIENLCIEDFFERVAFLEKPADLGNNIYCYIWIDGTATQVTGAWPGKRATDLGDNYYKYKIPSSAESINENWRIIWHDGTGKQTEDLVYENQGLYTGLSYSMVEFNRYISNICDPSPVPEIHVDEATPSANARKIIKDGNLYILHGDDIYNAQGERIK